MPTRLRGEPVAGPLRETVADSVTDLRDRGVVPTLGTVLMSDDPNHERFVALKHAACADVGIETRERSVDPAASTACLSRAIESLSADAEVHAVFVQVPLPEHVNAAAVRTRLDPRKDVDCFHPENVGLLAGDTPRFVPATAAAVEALLAHYDVETAGKDAVIVGRSAVIGRPLAHRLLRDDPRGNATVTICHSQTTDLGEETRRGDIVITAAGRPGLVDGSMLSPGVVVVDVSANRRSADGEIEVVGDVDRESAAGPAAAITPVPGGVGPVTLATLLANVVRATERQVENRPDG